MGVTYVFGSGSCGDGCKGNKVVVVMAAREIYIFFLHKERIFLSFKWLLASHRSVDEFKGSSIFIFRYLLVVWSP